MGGMIRHSSKLPKQRKDSLNNVVHEDNHKVLLCENMHIEPNAKRKIEDDIFAEGSKNKKSHLERLDGMHIWMICQ